MVSSTALANDALHTWLAELRLNAASNNTLSGYERSAKEALGHIAQLHRTPLAELELTRITRDDVVAALSAYQSRPDKRTGRAATRAPSTLGSYYTCLHSFFAWCVLSERLVKSPMARLRAPKVPSRVPKAMSNLECEALLRAARQSKNPERDYLAILLGLTAGLRLAEIATLKTTSIRYDQGYPTNLCVIGKGNKERVVPMNKRLAEALRNYLEVRPGSRESSCDALLLSQRGSALTRDGVSQLFDATTRRAGLKVPGRRVHACRHSFATHVLSAGADIVSVAELMGHANVSTTQGYLRVNPVRLASAVSANSLAQGF